jgi:2-dehydro-3-deoxyglucarate aldolase/4-hydroxy-2-oxoheptanedioate aldolase
MATPENEVDGALSHERHGTGSVTRSLHALELLAVAAHDEAELAERLGVHRRTVRRLLSQLIAEGWVTADPSGVRYVATVKPAVLAGKVLEQADLARAAYPAARALREQTCESAHLSVPGEAGVIHLINDIAEGALIVRPRFGEVVPYHATAVGKVLLAYDPDAERRLSSLALDRYTANTLTKPSDLLIEFARIRQRGYGVDNREHSLEVICVAAPVFDHQSVAIAALGISAPSMRFGEGQIEDAARIVVEAAVGLSAMLGHPGDSVGRMAPELSKHGNQARSEAEQILNPLADRHSEDARGPRRRTRVTRTSQTAGQNPEPVQGRELSSLRERRTIGLSDHSPSLRSRLRAGEFLIGSFVNLGSPLTAEIMAIGGFDWLVVDLEHGAGGEEEMLAQLHAVERRGVAALVRVEAVEGARFMHALDRGASGVLVPRVSSVEDARRSVSYCRYSGSRGVARYNRAWRWGLDARPLDDVDNEIVCAIQIETLGALKAADEIAALDGVDILFVGPVDLAHSLEVKDPHDSPALLDRISEVARIAHAHGKAAGILAGTVEQANAYRELGFTFLGCSSDSGLLVQEARRVSDELRHLGVSDGRSSHDQRVLK